MHKARAFFYVCAGLFCLAPCLHVAAANAEVIVPFGSCGWKYAFGLPGHVTVWSVTGVDDSQWANGCAPFVAPWGCAPPGTAWPVNQRLVVRRHIFNPGGAANLTYRVRGRWSIETAWNGNGGNAGGPANECPPGMVVGLFPLSPGDNVFAVDAYAIDDGLGAQNRGGHLDIELSADGITGVTLRSWGAVKIIYR